MRFFEDFSAEIQTEHSNFQINDFRVNRESGAPSIVISVDGKSFRMPYRLISQEILYKHGYSGVAVLDYTLDGVLKDSVPLASGITILRDHNMSSNGWLGKVIESFWSEEINGQPIPGINGVCEFALAKDDLDREWIQRGIREGYLQGMSVGLSIDWEQSHPDLDTCDFFRKMGTIYEGDLVRVLVKKINRYYETSVCIAGVDPSAGPVRGAETSDKNMIAMFSMAQGWEIPDSKIMVVNSYQAKKEEIQMEELKEVRDTQDNELDVCLEQRIAELEAQRDELRGRIESEVQMREAAEIDSFCSSLKHDRIIGRDGEYIVSQAVVDLANTMLRHSNNVDLIEFTAGVKITQRDAIKDLVTKFVGLAAKNGILAPVGNLEKQSHESPEDGADPQARRKAAISEYMKEGHNYQKAWNLAAKNPKNKGLFISEEVE